MDMKRTKYFLFNKKIIYRRKIVLKVKKIILVWKKMFKLSFLQKYDRWYQ